MERGGGSKGGGGVLGCATDKKTFNVKFNFSARSVSYKFSSLFRSHLTLVRSSMSHILN